MQLFERPREASAEYSRCQYRLQESCFVATRSPRVGTLLLPLAGISEEHRGVLPDGRQKSSEDSSYYSRLCRFALAANEKRPRRFTIIFCTTTLIALLRTTPAHDGCSHRSSMWACMQSRARLVLSIAVRFDMTKSGQFGQMGKHEILIDMRMPLCSDHFLRTERKERVLRQPSHAYMITINHLSSERGDAVSRCQYWDE